MVGIIPETFTEGGWILNTVNVTVILPAVEAFCVTLPPEAPVIVYCLDKISFSQADTNCIICQIGKLEDHMSHVVGEHIVSHEITVPAAVTNLKRILTVCSNRNVCCVCCSSRDVCIHRQISQSSLKLLDNLKRQHTLISRLVVHCPRSKIFTLSPTALPPPPLSDCPRSDWT
jgi:hypothetical protein